MDDADVLAVIVEAFLLKHLGYRSGDDLEIVGAETRSLLRREYIVVCPALNLFMTDVKGSFKCRVD